jgi:hypothetical protein
MAAMRPPEQPSSDPAAYRQAVVDLLHTLASEAEQLDYQQRVPHVDVSQELQCQWFDDLYHPEEQFWGARFRPEELEAMLRFHEVFREKAGSLPRGGIARWLKAPAWRDVMEAAALALRAFEPRPLGRTAE